MIRCYDGGSRQNLKLQFILITNGHRYTHTHPDTQNEEGLSGHSSQQILCVYACVNICICECVCKQFTFSVFIFIIVYKDLRMFLY